MERQKVWLVETKAVGIFGTNILELRILSKTSIKTNRVGYYSIGKVNGVAGSYCRGI